MQLVDATFTRLSLTLDNRINVGRRGRLCRNLEDGNVYRVLRFVGRTFLDPKLWTGLKVVAWGCEMLHTCYIEILTELGLTDGRPLCIRRVRVNRLHELLRQKLP